MGNFLQRALLAARHIEGDILGTAVDSVRRRTNRCDRLYVPSLELRRGPDGGLGVRRVDGDWPVYYKYNDVQQKVG